MVGKVLVNELFNATSAFRKPRRKVQLVPCLCRETGMSIAIQSSDELEQLRSRLRKMTDAQLVSFAKRAYYSHRPFTTHAVSFWESEELDERPHALFLTAAPKSLGSC